MPKSNVFFREQKIRRNKARDIANEYVLKTEGWKVIRIWECEIRKIQDRNQNLERLYRKITGNPPLYGENVDYEKMVAEPSAEYSNL